MLTEWIIKFIFNEVAALQMLAAATGLVGLAECMALSAAVQQCIGEAKAVGLIQRPIDKHCATGKLQVGSARLPPAGLLRTFSSRTRSWSTSPTCSGMDNAGQNHDPVAPFASVPRQSRQQRGSRAGNAAPTLEHPQVYLSLGSRSCCPYGNEVVSIR